MSLKKESFMKKAFCLLLAILLAAPLWTLPGTAAAEKPVITAPADGNVLAAGDVTIHWTAVSGADYYTVNIRYIENGENGPLAANAVPVDGTSYTLPEETTAALGNGAYRICVASVHGTEVRYSDTVTFRLADGNEPLLGKKAVFFGDSLTASFGWCRQLALRFGLEAVNAGVGGETSEMARARFEADVLAQSPDYVFICFGMNDQVHADHRNPRVSVERFAENITYFVTEAQRADAEVILITPNCVEESGYYTNPVHPESDYTAYGGVNAYLNRYCAKVREIASAYGTGLVDLFAEFWGREPYPAARAGRPPSDSGRLQPLCRLRRRLFTGAVCRRQRGGDDGAVRIDHRQSRTGAVSADGAGGKSLAYRSKRNRRHSPYDADDETPAHSACGSERRRQSGRRNDGGGLSAAQAALCAFSNARAGKPTQRRRQRRRKADTGGLPGTQAYAARLKAKKRGGLMSAPFCLISYFVKVSMVALIAAWKESRFDS